MTDVRNRIAENTEKGNPTNAKRISKGSYFLYPSPLYFIEEKKESRAMMSEEEVINESQLEFLQLPKGTYFGMAVSPNGKYLCVSVRQPHVSFELVLWDIQKEEIVRTFKATSYARCMQFSPDSKYIGVGYSSSVVIYDLNGKIVNVISPDLPMAHFAWRPNGKHITIATHTPCFFVANALEKRRMRHWQYPPRYDDYYDKVFGVAWHPDGKRLAVLHEYGLTIHEMPYLRIIRHDESEYAGGGKPPLVYSPDGRYIALRLDIVLIFDGETLELLPEDCFPYSGGGNITFYDWAVQRYITISTTANEVCVWNFERGETEKVWKFKFKEYTYPEQVLMHPGGMKIFAMFMERGVAVLHL